MPQDAESLKNSGMGQENLVTQHRIPILAMLTIGKGVERDKKKAQYYCAGSQKEMLIRVTDMAFMFGGATSFTQNLCL